MLAIVALLQRVISVASSERGQTLAEYGMILGLIAVGVVIPTVLIFRNALSDVFALVTVCLQDLPDCS